MPIRVRVLRGVDSAPGPLRSRLDDAIEATVEDVRQWNIESRTEEAERELLCSLQGAVRKIVRSSTVDLAAEDGEDE
ncbi:hypothetical protein ACIQU1_23015 [Streptomyces angustmyceticus]|uniref:hypothetical protein n=1 Tax=Streptomyces angustmyceticus TaxID=285578 RepID=UPI003450AF76